MAWLLKAVAIELKVTAANNQLSVVSAMVETYTGSKDLFLDRPQSQDVCAFASESAGNLF